MDNLLERDSMLSVGEVPWHGKGTTMVEPPKDSQEALEISGLDWTVSRVPVSIDSGFVPVRIAGTVSKKNEGAYGAIVRDDISDPFDPDRIMGVVGPNYVPFQNHEMGQIFDGLIAEDVLDIHTCGSLFNGKRVWMLGRFRQEAQEIRKDDKVESYCLLSHGHDGNVAVRFGFTPIRVVCWNTLSYAHDSEDSKLVRCLHTESLGRNLETLAESISVAREVFEMTCETYRELSKQRVSRADLQKYAVIVSGQEGKKPDELSLVAQKTIQQIVDNAEKGRGNNGHSWWDAYNGCTEWLTWQRGRSVDRRLDSLWTGESKKIAETALELALSMSA